MPVRVRLSSFSQILRDKPTASRAVAIPSACRITGAGRYALPVARDPLAIKADADAALERAASQLRGLLEEAARSLRPFPPFPGAFFTNAIEVELAGAERPDIGCIVLTDDGSLYELEMEIDFGEEFAQVVDPVQAREERLKPLDGLHPRDYVVLAYNALSQLAALLLERAAGAEGR